MENQTTQKKGFGGWLEKTFSITERNSTVKTEIIAGLTTFFAMCYIVIVNPNSIAGSAEANPEIWNSVYVGGTIAAVIGTLLMAFVAKGLSLRQPEWVSTASSSYPLFFPL